MKRILIKLELNRVPISKILEELLLQLQNPKKGINISTFNTKLEEECGDFLN